MSLVVMIMFRISSFLVDNLFQAKPS